mgnify:FL=1
MIFILLNCILLVCFISLTYYIDKKGSDLALSGNSILVSLLFACLEVFLYILVMLFKDKWLESLTMNFIRIIFCLDGIFLVSFSFGLIGISTKIDKFFPRLIQWILYIFVIFLHYLYYLLTFL